MTERTSHTHPLRIDTYAHPLWNGGRLGITFCPGKKQDDAMTGRWNRDLESDLERINAWRPDEVVTLLEDHEFDLLGVADLPLLAAQQPWVWLHLPTRDEHAPSPEFMLLWHEGVMGERLCNRLRRGGSVLVHCKGGLGRAGTLAAMLLRQSGVAATSDEAIAIVRQVRGKLAIDPPQEHFLQGWSP